MLVNRSTITMGLLNPSAQIAKAIWQQGGAVRDPVICKHRCCGPGHSQPHLHVLWATKSGTASSSSPCVWVQEHEGIGRRLVSAVVPVGCTGTCHGTGNHPGKILQ